MFLISGLLADFLSYIKDNLILFILCIVCLAAIVSILVILAVTAKKAKKNQSQNQSQTPTDAEPETDNAADSVQEIPEQLPQAAEEPVKDTHDVPASESDTTEPVESVDPVAEEPKAESEPEAQAEEGKEEAKESSETKPEADTDTVVVVEPPKEAAEEPKAEEPDEKEAEEKNKQPPRKKIVVTTRRNEKKSAAKPLQTDGVAQKAEEPEVIEIVPAPKTEEKPESDVIEIVPPPQAEEKEAPETAKPETTQDETPSPSTEAEAETEDSIADATETEEKKKPQYAGKWVFNEVVTVDEAGEEKEKDFFFQLKASNGETLIFSEEYTSLRGANQGVDTFKTNIAKDNFKITVSKKGKYVIKLLTSQGSLLAQGAHYNNRAAAQSGVASIKRFAATAIKQDDVQVIMLPYEEVTESAKEYDPDKKGKWVVRKAVAEDGGEESYYFELRASNGQLLFTSEEYTTLNGAKTGIGTHKANIESGNIRPVITRNGDYVLKIYAGNGQLLCLGEHYSTKQLCQNAVESVKRFAETAEIVEEIETEE